MLMRSSDATWEACGKSRMRSEIKLINRNVALSTSYVDEEIEHGKGFKRKNFHCIMQ